MNYTNENEQIVFLRDADIARSIDGKTIAGNEILSNGVPAFDLFRERYDELSAYDNSICAYIRYGIEVSVNNISTELHDLRNEAIKLSDDICLSVKSLSDIVHDKISVDLYELSAGTKETSSMLSDQINALWDDVRGGINYKGHMSADYTTKFPGGEPYAISTLFASYYNLLNDMTKELTADKKLNNGWLYNFTTTDLSGYKTADGTVLENNDYLIVHAHGDGISSISVSEMSRADVDIIEAVQDDYVRFALLKQISDCLSDDYVKKIYNLSSSLCGTISISANNIQNQIISNDNDIRFLSDCLSVEIENNIDAVHYKGNLTIDGLNHELSTILYGTIGHVSDYKFRKGFMYRIDTAWEISDNTENAYSFEVNDYLMFKNDAKLPNVFLSDLTYVKDYDKEIERTYDSLTAQLNCTSAFLSNDMLSNDQEYTGNNCYYGTAYFSKPVTIDSALGVSSKITAQAGMTTYGGVTMQFNPSSGILGGSTITLTQNNITKSSSDENMTYDYPEKSGTLAVTQDVEDLRAEAVKLSDDICLSVHGISSVVTVLSANLCADISSLCACISTDIDTYYSDLTSQINSTSSYISGEVAKNDNDIANIQNYISGDSSLCTMLSDLSGHYHKTFIEDTYDKGPDKNVDVLKVVNSEDTNTKFKLIYLSGTLVLQNI